MQLIGIENIVFLCFGAAMVGFYSWSRFDEELPRALLNFVKRSLR